MARTICPLLRLVIVLCCPAIVTPASAQSTLAPSAPALASPAQVISSNPFGLLIDLVNVEYERGAAEALTVGVGASRAGWGAPSGRAYVNGDVFVRLYPGGRVFEGRSFGIKAGMTRFPGTGRIHFGVGVDANQTWMLSRHVAFSTGFGLKRLSGTEATGGPRLIPTLRFNVGVGF